jgi:hypothetical protein
MFERILRRLREKVRARQYVMTVHAVEEMDDDGLTIFDIERTILTGKIIERQKDTVTGEYKYLIQGRAITEDEVIVVTKLSPTDKLIIITVYLE